MNIRKVYIVFVHGEVFIISMNAINGTVLELLTSGKDGKTFFAPASIIAW